MECSKQIQKQADEQLHASTEDGGSAGSGSGASPAGPGSLLDFGSVLLRGVQWLDGVVKWIGTNWDELKAGRVFLGHFGTALGLYSAYERLRDAIETGNPAQAIWGVMDAISVPPTPIGPIWTVLSTAADLVIPVSDAEQAALLDFIAMDTYGKDMEDLTPAQRESIREQFQGPEGILYMMGGELSRNLAKIGVDS